jgi:hypothetical protein
MEPARPDKVPAQDAAQATAPVKVALVALAAEGLAVVDVDLVAVSDMLQDRVAPG